MTKYEKILGTLKNIDQMPDGANIDVDTVAAIFDVEPVTVWRHSRKGLLRPIKFGRSTRWNLGEIRALVAGKVPQ